MRCKMLGGLSEERSNLVVSMKLGGLFGAVAVQEASMTDAVSPMSERSVDEILDESKQKRAAYRC